MDSSKITSNQISKSTATSSHDIPLQSNSSVATAAAAAPTTSSSSSSSTTNIADLSKFKALSTELLQQMLKIAEKNRLDSIAKMSDFLFDGGDDADGGGGSVEEFQAEM